MKNKEKKAVPATGRYRPVTERLIPREYSDRSSYYPSNGLTPRKLARIFKAADLGDVSEQMELFEEMEEKEQAWREDLELIIAEIEEEEARLEHELEDEIHRAEAK